MRESIELPARAMLTERIAWRLVLGLTVVNLLVTGWIAAAHLDPFADLATYYQEAENIAAGKGMSLDIKIVVNARKTDAPFPVGDRFLYPLVTAAALRLFGDSLSVANLVSALAMCLLALPLYGLGNALFGWRAGLAGVVLFVFNPFYHILGVGGWTDLLATLWYYACLYCAARWVLANDAGPRWPALAGLCFALAALTREDAVVLALVAALAWWWRGHRLADGVALAAAPLVALGVRSLYLLQNFGSPIYNERSYFFLPRWALWYYLGSFSAAEYLDYVGGITEAIAIRIYNYSRFLENLFSDGMLYFTQTGLMPSALVVALVAAFRTTLTALERRVVLGISAVVCLQLVLGIGYPGYAGNSTEVRHGQLIAPWLLLLAGAGLVSLWDRLRWQRLIAVALAGIYIVFAVAQFGAWANALIQPAYRGPVVLAAEWAAHGLPPEAVLMTRRAAEAHYYSGKTVVATPSAPLAMLLDYARAHHVSDFLITDVERAGAPNLLQGFKAFPANFRTVYSTEGAQIVAWTGADFPAPLTVPNELYAGKTVGRPDRLFAWQDLQPGGAGAILDQISAWGNLLTLLAHPARSPRPLAQVVNVRAGENIALVRYALANSALQPGADAQVTLWWQSLAPVKANLTVFVHLLDANGLLRAQQDSPPLGGARPTYVWEAGETIEDHYSFSVPAELAAGPYQLEIGLYDPAGGARVPLRDPAGNRLPDDRLLVSRIQIGE